MPPLAVPSSLVSTMPVTSTTSAKTRAWVRPFWPVVASRTSSTSSTGPCFSMTRLTLPSSSIRPTLFCSRPAVSTSTTSSPPSAPCLTASNATLAGSPPSGPRTTGAPTRSPQVVELVGGGGAERVGGAEQHGAAVGDQHPGQLADGGGLAGAVDADDEHDGRAAVGCRWCAASGRASGRRGSSSSSRSMPRTAAGVAGAEHLDPGAQPLDQLLGRRRRRRRR